MQRAKGIALVGRADAVRAQLTQYLRDGGFDVVECDDVAIPARLFAVVIIDDGEPPAIDLRGVVQAWITAGSPQRVVVVTPKPASWKALALAHGNRLWVLAAPAFGWQIVDALRATAAR